MNNTGVPDKQNGYEAKWHILIAVMLGNIMGPLDGSIVNTVLPEITGFFETEISTAQWVPTIYLLTISCLILLYGRLGDMLGYKRIFLYGLATFTVTSALCGFSQSIWMLISFRALQGLAAGMMMAVSFAIITAAFPPTERGKALGISAVGIAVGLGLGPTLGGAIAEHLSWRYVFFINIPIGITSLIWCYRVIPQGIKKPGQRLDIYGALIAFVFLLSLLLYANRGEAWGWLSASCISLLIVALFSGMLFFYVERKSAQPMLNLTLFSNRVFSFNNLSALLSFMSAYALIFLTPFYLAFVLHYSVLKVGYVMIAAPMATLVISPLSGILSDRIGTRGLAACGMTICGVGLLFLSGLKETDGSLDVAWRLAIFGLGFGVFQSPNNSAVMGSVPQMYLGIASGILAAMRNVGMVLGIAICSAVLYNLAPVVVAKQPGAFTNYDMIEFLDGMHWAYISAAGFAFISALISLLATARPKQAKHQ